MQPRGNSELRSGVGQMTRGVQKAGVVQRRVVERGQVVRFGAFRFGFGVVLFGFGVVQFGVVPKEEDQRHRSPSPAVP